MTFDHDFGNFLPLFSREIIAKILIKSHAFLLDHVSKIVWICVCPNVEGMYHIKVNYKWKV